MKAIDYIKQAEDIAPVSSKAPNTTFINFYKKNRKKLKDIITNIYRDNKDLQNFKLHTGIMLSENAVISEMIKGLCRLPHMTPDGPTESCDGILLNWKGCPGYSPKITNTIDLLSKAQAFLIIQLEGNESNYNQNSLRLFLNPHFS